MGDSDIHETRKDSLNGFRTFSILLGVGVAAWSLFLVVEWLRSDWPLVAVFPAMFVVVCGGSAYGMWRHGYGAWGSTPAYSVTVWAAAVIAVLGVVSLHYASNRTGDEVYAGNAKAMVFWGSLPVLVALLSLIFRIPTIQRRIDSNRAAAEESRKHDHE